MFGAPVVLVMLLVLLAGLAVLAAAVVVAAAAVVVAAAVVAVLPLDCTAAGCAGLLMPEVMASKVMASAEALGDSALRARPANGVTDRM